MSTIFDKLLRFAYAKDLHEHLKGYNITCDDYTASSTYGYITTVIFVAAPILMLNYYYGIFNRPKLSSIGTWLLNILGGGAIVFGIAMTKSIGDLKSKNYCQELKFGSTDCILFGATAATYMVLACIIVSVVVKWWSLNNKKIPF